MEIKSQSLGEYFAFKTVWSPSQNTIVFLGWAPKEGRILLSTHGDLLICDSMALVTRASMRLISAAVYDNHFIPQLVAFALVPKEDKRSWSLFWEVRHCSIVTCFTG